MKKKGTDEEWEVILSHFLLQKQPEGKNAKALDGVRMEYALKGDNVEITIRRDVQGIKVSSPVGVCSVYETNTGQMTLGQIELQKEPDEEIDPIDWAYRSAQAHNAALQKMTELKAMLDAERGTMDKLNAQFEQLLKAKDETESAMLQQFMTLLNEKKRKIRDQSRLLAGAKVDKTAGMYRIAYIRVNLTEV